MSKKFKTNQQCLLCTAGMRRPEHLVYLSLVKASDPMGKVRVVEVGENPDVDGNFEKLYLLTDDKLHERMFDELLKRELI